MEGPLTEEAPLALTALNKEECGARAPTLTLPDLKTISRTTENTPGLTASNS